MRRRYAARLPSPARAVALLVALSFVLSGCSVIPKSLQLTAPPTSTPVTLQPLAAGAGQPVPTPAFDASAGNCPDAATQAINLMQYTQAQGMTLDIQVALQPLAQCGATAAADVAAYRMRVTSASLSAYVIDGTWSANTLSVHTALIDNLLAQMHSLYPAATLSINVYYNGSVVGTGQLGADNVPHVQCCSG